MIQLHPILTQCRPMAVWPVWAETLRARPSLVRAGGEQAVGGEAGGGEAPSTAPAIIDHGGGIREMRIDSWMTLNADEIDALYGALDHAHIARAALALAADPEVKGVLVSFDSPGGSVAGSATSRSAIAALARAKPTIGLAMEGGMMASAAYELGSAIPELYAEKESITGSIGTIINLLDTSGFYEKMGIKPAHIASPEGKGYLRAGVPIKPEHVDDLKAIVDRAAGEFFQSVASARGLTVERVHDLQAAVFDGHGAVKHGLVNGVMEYGQAINRLRAIVFMASGPATPPTPTTQNPAPVAGAAIAPADGAHTSKGIMIMNATETPASTQATPPTNTPANPSGTTAPTEATTAVQPTNESATGGSIPVSFEQADALVPAEIPGRDAIVSSIVRAKVNLSGACQMLVKASQAVAQQSATTAISATPVSIAQAPSGWSPPAPVQIAGGQAAGGGLSTQQAMARAFAQACADMAVEQAASSLPVAGQPAKPDTANAVNTLRFTTQYAAGYAAWNAEGGKPDPRTFLKS